MAQPISKPTSFLQGIRPCLHLAALLLVLAADAEAASPTLRFGEKGSFRNMLQGETHEESVEIFNDGDAPLVITKVTASCGCTTILNYPETLLPGASGVIKFSLNTKKIKPGEALKEIRVFSNDPNQQPRAGWRFTTHVINLFQTNPAQIYLTGILDQPKSATIEVIALTDLGLELIDAKSRGGHFKVTGIEPVEVNKKYRVGISAGAFDKAGEIKDPLDLTIRTKDGREVTVGRWVLIQNRDHIVFSPNDVLMFKNADTNKLLESETGPIEKKVVVAAALPSTEFEVSKVSIESDAHNTFRCEVRPVVDKKRYEVIVRISEYSDQTYTRAKLVIETTYKRKPRHEINLRAIFGRRVRR